MHHTKIIAPLVSSIHSVSWQNALAHFQRSLIECGSALETEHSQRVGLLFSKKVGADRELEKWASIFNAEEVPTTALILKALVNHNRWKMAIKMFEWSAASENTGEICENLSQFLVANGYWEQSLMVVSKLLSVPPNAEMKEEKELTVANVCARGALIENALQDITELSRNPNYLPLEERSQYCGIASTVCRAFPLNRQWADAVKMLEGMEQHVGSSTREKLREYAVARTIYGGGHYKKVLEWAKKAPLYSHSASLNRSILFCALIEQDISVCLNCLENLSIIGCHSIPTKSFESTCLLFMGVFPQTQNCSHLNKFLSILSKSMSRIKRKDVQKRVFDFLAANEVDLSLFAVLEKANEQVKTNSFVDSTRNFSVSELDAVISLLIKQSKWREALSFIECIIHLTPQNEKESIICATVASYSNDWQKALLFFS